MSARQTIPHAVQSSGLADVLERVLDKGMVITGDIRIKLVDIELLTIQIRLIICSVERAREMGMDWWTTNPQFSSLSPPPARIPEMEHLQDRVQKLERQLAGETAAGKT